METQTATSTVVPPSAAPPQPKPGAPEAPKTPAEPATPAVVPQGKDAARFAALARQTAEIQRDRAAVQAERAAVATEKAKMEAEVKVAREESAKWQSIQALAKKDQLAAMKELGIDYNSVSEQVVAGGKITPEQRAKQLEEQIAVERAEREKSFKEIEEKRAGEKQSAEKAQLEQQQREALAVLDEHRRSIDGFLETNKAKFPLAVRFGGTPLLEEMIQADWNMRAAEKQTAKGSNLTREEIALIEPMTVEAAADKANSFYKNLTEESARELGWTPAVQQGSTAVNGKAPAAPKQEPKTLNGTMTPASGEAPKKRMTEKEAIANAMVVGRAKAAALKK